MAPTSVRATTKIERIDTEGESLVHRIKELIHEGNVRHIRITHAGHTVMEFPLSVGVVGTLAAPWLAAVGGLAAVVTDCTIEVERDDEEPATAGESASRGERS